DDLLRSLEFDKALVLLYDEQRGSLRGSFGLGIKDAAAQTVECSLSEGTDPIVAALRGGVPTLVADVARDQRLSGAARDAFRSDDLLRSLEFDKALVLLYDEQRGSLRGSFGLGIKDAAAQTVECSLSEGTDPIVAALRGGVPTLVADVARDQRLSGAARDAL